MNTEQLNYLLRIRQHQSISKAARDLFVSEQMISKAMKKLEEDMGRKLLLTSSKGCVLTPFGEKTADFAQDFLRESADMLEKIEELERSKLTGTITIKCTHSTMVNIIPEMMLFMLRKYPGVALSIQEGGTQAILDDMLRQRIDLGVISRGTFQEKSSVRLPKTLQYIKLIDTQLVFWSHQSLHLTDFAQTAAHKIVMYSKYDLASFNWMFKQVGLEIENKLFPVDNMYLIKKLVEEGWAICPDIAVSEDGIVFADIFKDSPVHCQALTLEGYQSEVGILVNHNSGPLKEVLQLLVQKVVDYFRV